MLETLGDLEKKFNYQKQTLEHLIFSCKRAAQDLHARFEVAVESKKAASENTAIRTKETAEHHTHHELAAEAKNDGPGTTMWDSIDHWEEHHCEANNCSYWYNNETGEKIFSLEGIARNKNECSENMLVHGKAAAKHFEATVESKCEGTTMWDSIDRWEEHYCETYNCLYWYNIETGEKKWSLAEGADEPVESPSPEHYDIGSSKGQNGDFYDSDVDSITSDTENLYNADINVWRDSWCFNEHRINANMDKGQSSIPQVHEDNICPYCQYFFSGRTVFSKEYLQFHQHLTEQLQNDPTFLGIGDLRESEDHPNAEPHKVEPFGPKNGSINSYSADSISVPSCQASLVRPTNEANKRSYVGGA